MIVFAALWSLLGGSSHTAEYTLVAVGLPLVCMVLGDAWCRGVTPGPSKAVLQDSSVCCSSPCSRRAAAAVKSGCVLLTVFRVGHVVFAQCCGMLQQRLPAVCPTWLEAVMASACKLTQSARLPGIWALAHSESCLTGHAPCMVHEHQPQCAAAVTQLASQVAACGWRQQLRYSTTACLTARLSSPLVLAQDVAAGLLVLPDVNGARPHALQRPLQTGSGVVAAFSDAACL